MSSVDQWEKLGYTKCEDFLVAIDPHGKVRTMIGMHWQAVGRKCLLTLIPISKVSLFSCQSFRAPSGSRVFSTRSLGTSASNTAALVSLTAMMEVENLPSSSIYSRAIESAYYWHKIDPPLLYTRVSTCQVRVFLASFDDLDTYSSTKCSCDNCSFPLRLHYNQ